MAPAPGKGDDVNRRSAACHDVQADYLLDLLMDDAKNGVALTYIYQLLNADAPGSPQGSSMVIEKSSGAHDAVIWAEPRSCNATTGSEIAAPSTNVIVTLGSTYDTNRPLG